MHEPVENAGRGGDDARVRVTVATVDDKPVLRRLLELNAHEFSELDGRDPGPSGEFGSPYLDHYWTEGEHRQPFLIRVGDVLAGCVLVRSGQTSSIAEFFVLRKHRRSGVGTAAARAVFAARPGPWRVHQVRGNDAAVAFWRRAIPVRYDEEADTDGTTQRFTIGPDQPRTPGATP